jgi:REP element-mobilizing transposase RayT
MKPSKGSKHLRKGRASIKNQHYLLTTTVLDRKPLLNQEGTAKIVIASLHWLEKQEQIILDAAVVMPDHLHFVAGLKNGSLATIMRSLKSHTAKKINILLKIKANQFIQN